MLARLQQRHGDRDKPVKRKDDGHDLDLVLERAAALASDSTSDREQTIQLLEAQLQQEENSYKVTQIRKALLELKPKPQASTAPFQFAAQPQKPIGAFKFSALPSRPAAPQAQASGPLIPNMLDGSDLFKIENIDGEERRFDEATSVDGEVELRISNIKNSTLRISFPTHSVRMRDIQDSTLVLHPSTSSISIDDAKNVKLFCRGDQIRIHRSSNTTLYCAFKTGIIMEHCRGIKLAPYRVLGIDGEMIEISKTDLEMAAPQDMDQLGLEGPRNWHVAEESEWITEKLGPFDA
ncbi:unnamed protein product, partial [Mesorhabditis spiculigera]